MPNEYLQRKEIRKAVLEKFANSFIGNWQDKATPDWIVRDMVGQVEDKPELLYCVLFNMEFLEELVYNRGISRERIMYMADNRHEAKAARELYEVKTMRTRKELGVKRTIERVVRKARKAFYEGKEMPKTNNLVVFGNPPYQQQSEAQKNRSGEGGTEQAKPIYHLFVEAVIDNLNPRYLSFITPSKWMAGGMGLGKFRERMMKDSRIRSIRHFQGEKEVFSDVSVKGGVSYFLWDREYKGKCNFNGMHRFLNEYDVIVTDNKSISILDKIKSSCESFVNDKCFANKPFGLATNFKGWKNSGILCYSSNKVKKFVQSGEFTDKNNIQGVWKACTSAANGAAQEDTGNGKRVISDAFIIEKGSICTETYIVVNTFDTEVEAENFVTYMKTKFFRFLLGIRLVTQHINTEKFAFVPDLGDYSKPVTDADLYKRFGLTPEEIAYIESKIKALDNGNGSSSAAA